MEVIAKGKHIRISPKKVRPIANLVRGKNAHESQVMLSQMPQKAAKLIGKVLTSAMANAENNFKLDKKELTISEVMIDSGSVLKRHRPRAFGRASEIKKRTSHISIVVSGDIKTKKQAVEKKAEEIKSEINQDDSKKIEMKKPESGRSDVFTSKSDAKGAKMFRRKTG